MIFNTLHFGRCGGGEGVVMFYIHLYSCSNFDFVLEKSHGSNVQLWPCAREQSRQNSLACSLKFTVKIFHLCNFLCGQNIVHTLCSFIYEDFWFVCLFVADPFNIISSVATSQHTGEQNIPPSYHVRRIMCPWRIMTGEKTEAVFISWPHYTVVAHW